MAEPTFADVVNVVDAEREISSITADESDIVQRGLLQVKSEIGALLSTDELVGYVIEDWSSQPALTQQNTEMGQTARTKMHAQHDAEKTDIALSRAVENLFDFLPGIRAERHAYCYDKEVSGEHRTHQKATAQSGGTNFPDIREKSEGLKSVKTSRENIEKGKRTTKLVTDEKSAGDLREEMKKAFVTKTTSSTNDITPAQYGLKDRIVTIPNRI